MPSLNLANGLKLHPREPNITGGILAAVNNEVVVDLVGCSGVFAYFATTGNISIALEGSYDGVNYIPLIAYPLNGALANVPNITLANPGVSAWFVRTAGMVEVRARCTAYTAQATITLVGSNVDFDREPTTPLSVTSTAAVNTALTLTIPAVAGMRHKLKKLRIERYNSSGAALAALNAPVIVTSTNLPGSWSTNMSTEALVQGDMTEKEIDLANLISTTAGTATTFVYPATVGVIAKMTALYDLGL